MARFMKQELIGQLNNCVSLKKLAPNGSELPTWVPIKCKLRVICARFLLFLLVFIIFNETSNESNRYARIYQQKNEVVRANVETHVVDGFKTDTEIRQYIADITAQQLLTETAKRMRNYGTFRKQIDVSLENSPSIKSERTDDSKDDKDDYKTFIALQYATELLINRMRKQNIPSIPENKKIMKNDVYAKRIADRITQASSATTLRGPTTGSRQPQDEYSERRNILLLDQNVSPPSGIWNYQRRLPGKTFLNELGGVTENRLLRSGVKVENVLVKRTGRHKYQPCWLIPNHLVGKVFVNANHSHNMTRKDVETDHHDLLPGGIWQPPDCVARHRVAIIIPYRDREQHLVLLLSHLLPILKRQQLNFEIFVIEQKGNDTFNKARIMNAAFKEAIKIYDFQCFVFHDVDLLPEDDRNMYSCPQQPRHMSVAIDEMNYKVPYEYLVGGVLSMRTEHFQKVNGYSNLYWGWGAEDDDMAFRIMHVGLKITRPPSMVARYKMIKHEKRKPTDWRKRTRLLRTGTRRFNFDGLNSVNYDLISIKKDPLFTHILVEIGKPPGVS